MRKSFALLLASLMLVFLLAACGSDRQSANSGTNNAGTAAPNQDAITGNDNANNGAANNGTANNGAGSNGTANNGAGNNGLGEDIENGLDRAGDAVRDGMNDLTGGTPSGMRTGGIGASYSQMLRNGRVHDVDGILTDHENAVTPGSDRF